MKQIFLKVYQNGKTTTNASVLNFDRENKSGEIVIDYSEVDFLDWDKQLDLIFSDGTTAFVTGTGNTLTVPLLEAYLKKGSMTVQPVAKRLVGAEYEKAKWQVVALSVRDSLNVLENDASITPSVAEQWEIRITEVEHDEVLRKAFETIRQNNENARIANENARLVFEAYDPIEDYTVGNKVAYNGSSYVCIADSTGNLPTNTTYWLLIAAMGETKNGKIITVAKENGDYVSIAEAVAAAQDSALEPVTIIICPGIYNEHVSVGTDRYISLIGVNKDTCIITTKTGSYQFNPLRFEGHGRVENLTLISSSEDSGIDRDTLYSYALHADSVDGVSCDFEVFNCKMTSDTSAAVGIGMKQGQTIKLTQCELISTTSATSSSNENGALYVHSSAETDISGQRFIVRDCIINSLYSRCVYVADLGLGTVGMNVTFINNNLWNEQNGVDGVLKVTTKTTGNLSGQINLTENSIGNNVELLNYKENIPLLDFAVNADWKAGVWTANSAADILICSVNHGLLAGDAVSFSSGTGVLPGGLSAEPEFYYVESVVDVKTIKVKLTRSGAAVDITSDGTVGWKIRLAMVFPNTISLDFSKYYEIDLYSTLSYAPNPANGLEYITLTLNTGCLLLMNLDAVNGTTRDARIYPSITKKYQKLSLKVNIKKLSNSYYNIKVEVLGVQSDNANMSSSVAFTTSAGGMVTGAEVTSIAISSLYYSKVMNGTRFLLFKR